MSKIYTSIEKCMGKNHISKINSLSSLCKYINGHKPTGCCNTRPWEWQSASQTVNISSLSNVVNHQIITQHNNIDPFCGYGPSPAQPSPARPIATSATDLAHLWMLQLLQLIYNTNIWQRWHHRFVMQLQLHNYNANYFSSGSHWHP